MTQDFRKAVKISRKLSVDKNIKGLRAEYKWLNKCKKKKNTNDCILHGFLTSFCTSVPQNTTQTQTIVFKEMKMDCNSSKQCHLRQLQQLKKKLLTLQQELEFRTQELQASYCSLLQYQSILEKQTSDLMLLHHHCKLKEDEVL